MALALQFQSTLPTRGSDSISSRLIFNTIISIHAPHEGERRHNDRIQRHYNLYFNPRSPRGGATSPFFFYFYYITYFNPRSPRGGATRRQAVIRHAVKISIHAPHEGERRKATNAFTEPELFQSTLPTRGSDPFLYILCHMS